MKEFVNKNFEQLALVAGFVALLVLALDINDILNKCVIGLMSCVAISYIGYAVTLFLFKRPEFDWHLINGRFMRKVCCLILLMPFLLTGISGCLIDSPHELSGEDNAYECQDCEFMHKTEEPNLFWITYYHFVDPGNQHMAITRSGRILAAIIAILGVFLLNGLLVSSIVGWVDIRKEKWLKGEVKYPRFLRQKSYDVVIGGNDMVVGLVKQRLISEKYILIQTSSDVESFRRNLFSMLTDEQQKHIIIYYGSRTSWEDVVELCLENAEEVYIVGEDRRADDMESFHDTMNMECLNLVYNIYKQSPQGQLITDMLPRVEAYRKQLKDSENDKAAIAALRNKEENAQLDAMWKSRHRLNCRVMFEYQTTFSVFQFFDLDAQMDNYINFIPFNSYEIWAQNILINKCVDKKQLEENFQKGGYLPLEGSCGIRQENDAYVHLFVVGMSRMGVAMAIEAAHLAHYPNYESKKIRTKITFVDKNAEEEKEFFMGRFQSLFALSNWRFGCVDKNGLLEWPKTHSVSEEEWAHLGGDILDIEWEFINGGIECASIQDYILSSANPNARVTIAICLPESNRSHAAALYLNKKIYESSSVLQVLVYNQYGNSIVDAIGKSNSEYPFCGKLRGFGCNENSTMCEHLEFSEEVGRQIENAYAGGKPQYAIKPASSYSGKSKSAGKWSSIYNGNTLWTKLRSVDFDFTAKDQNEAAIEVLADVEHNRWVVEELLMNFRPLSHEEQNEAKSSSDNKNRYKSQMAHLDICSNSKLKEVDGGVRKYDVELTKCLVNIYKALNGKA